MILEQQNGPPRKGFCSNPHYNYWKIYSIYNKKWVNLTNSKSRKNERHAAFPVEAELQHSSYTIPPSPELNGVEGGGKRIIEFASTKL